VTNGSGVFDTTYTAPVIGQVVRVTATSGSVQVSDDLEVRVPGLQWLSNSPLGHWDLIGQTASHPDNHFGTSSATGGLTNIAADYRGQYPSASALRYNDLSVPAGGKFDLANNWQDGGSHAEHRIGQNCDVSNSNVPADRYDYLEGRFVAHGSPNFLREFTLNHWHLRFTQ
jgi:hypothetical protein